MVHVDVMDAMTRAAARRRWRAEQWAHGRLRELAEELRILGVAAAVDWGCLSWEPCLIVDTAEGREIVWCRPVAIAVERGKPLYRWRFAWGDYRGRPAVCSYPAADVALAAKKIALTADGQAAARRLADAGDEP